ncbi:S41 family peptidase [Muriicola sp. Z0-33]|uniref:S41 family peptidase n=1 Tax=Muriicola sp. Z0-33 TaxID=2816957 RepID=UPI002237A982|nr:S41 family peptidase [Muriicola sp. Z0-33]MCW5517948.1 peptidase S41 [Muriicola sp. Z0-33]
MKQILLILILIPLGLYSQECDCEATFNWTKKTFEENDAGYQYIIDTKGQRAYTLHNQSFINKVKESKDTEECGQLLNEWLRFFRSGHIGLEYIGLSANNLNNTASGEADDDLNAWETFSIDQNKFKEYLEQKSVHDYEGIWQFGGYKIGIKKEGATYIGFIIDAKTNLWKKEQVKLKIFEQDGKTSSIFYMLNRSEVTSDNVSLYGKNNLEIGDIRLSRIYPKLQDNSPYRLAFNALNTRLPFMEQINETTLYFRIPSFTGTPEKMAIDSVIEHNKEKILSTENLIIDIRNGTGGSDEGYYEILPLIYTNPIRTPSFHFYSTPLNNKRWLDFIAYTGMAQEFDMRFSQEEKVRLRKEYDTLSRHIGEFVSFDTTAVTVRTYDQVYPFPKQVGIIHNHRNGSTDEQFLLDAMQSKKVKLFGRTTMGALDFSNMNRVSSPCNNFRLWYTLSKSGRIPNMAIDGIGIQPDYYIDEQVPEYEWINFVTKILNQ